MPSEITFLKLFSVQAVHWLPSLADYKTIHFVKNKCPVREGATLVLTPSISVTLPKAVSRVISSL